MNDSQNQNWLVRPTTIKLLWRVFIAILALTVMAQLVIKVKGYFGVDDWFGFAAASGFLSCVALVLLAKVLGFVLKRDENYYNDGIDDE